MSTTLLLRTGKLYVTNNTARHRLWRKSVAVLINGNTAHLNFYRLPGHGRTSAKRQASVRNKLQPTVIRGLISGQPLMVNGSPKVVDVITVAQR